MEHEVLLAIIFKRVEEKLKAISLPSRGPRGQRGRAGVDGKDGKDFNFSEHEETIKNWAREFSLKFEDLTIEEINKLRGPKGKDGRDGKDFDFSQHEETIKNWANEFALKFEDLTSDQIEKLRGPKGRDGKAGKDFKFEEHEETIKNWAQEFALKFEDLTAEQIEKVRGPKGRDGRDGKNFSFEENRESILQIVSELIYGIKDSLKLRFHDLSADDIEKLRGPRGRDGRDGRDGKSFDFEEHKDFFLSLKPKFSEFSEEEKAELKLKFSHLTEEEKAGLKLRFEDLTDEDRTKIKGPRGARGQRGQAGRDGVDGKDGKQGPRGLPGIMGLKGLPGSKGKDGKDGRDGEDAPYIVEIEVDQYKQDEFEFIFIFSDGSYVRSDPIKLPRSHAVFLGGGGGGSGGGADTTTQYQGYSNRFDEFFDTTGTEETLLQILDFGYAAPGIVLAGSVSTALREKGTVVASNTLTAVTVKRSEPITSVEFYKNGVLEYTELAPNPDGGSEQWIDAAGFDDTATYHAIAYDSTGSATSNTLTYSYVYPYYYGVGSPGLSAANVALLTKDIIGNTATVARAFSPTAQVYYFAYPAAYPSLTSILDNSGFETIADWTLRTENITGLDTNPVSYKIYEFNNLTTQTGFINTFRQ